MGEVHSTAYAKDRESDSIPALRCPLVVEVNQVVYM